MLDICRFCGYEGSDAMPFSTNETILKFYNILPAEIRCNDENLPRVFCQLCELKIVEIFEFFDRVEEVDKELRKRVLRTSLNLSGEVQTSNPSTSNINTDSAEVIVEKINEKGLSSVKKIPGDPSNTSSSCVDPLDISQDSPEVSCDEEMEEDLNSASDDEVYQDDEDIDPIYEPEPDRDTKSPILSKQSSNTPTARTKQISNGREVIVIDVVNPKYVCSKCRESFHTAALLKNHLFVTSACRDADVICKYCDKKFETRRKRIKHESFHERQNKPVPHECTNCARKFLSRALLAIHLTQCKGETIAIRTGLQYKCTECGEKLNSAALLLKHTKNHAVSKITRKSVECEICGLSFTTKPLYNDHIQTHPEMAKFPCSYCEKRFHTGRLLHAHRYEHSGIKSNICQDCGKGFVKKTSLNNHRRLEHTGETPFQCQICNMNFPTTDRLRVHQYKHIFKD